MNICCVCTGNTCRSPMLACLLRAQAHVLELDITVLSAGVAAGAGQAASGHAVQCMENRQLSLDDHRSTPIQNIDLKTIDRFYCMSDSHALMLYDAGVDQKKLFVVNAQNGGVPDPFGGPLSVYEQCASVLEQAAHDIIVTLKGTDG